MCLCWQKLRVLLIQPGWLSLSVLSQLCCVAKNTAKELEHYIWAFAAQAERALHWKHLPLLTEGHTEESPSCYYKKNHRKILWGCLRHLCSWNKSVVWFVWQCRFKKLAAFWVMQHPTDTVCILHGLVHFPVNSWLYLLLQHKPWQLCPHQQFMIIQ